MIRLDEAQQAAVDAHLSGPVVEARLRLESWLGDRMLGELYAGGGTLKWDGSVLRGLLDVDVQVDRLGALSPSHPVGPYGQTLRAFWQWPQIGVEVPCGWWQVNMPTRRDRHWWQVQADPRGMALLRNQRWTQPPETVVSGSASAQIGKMVAEAAVQWIPAASWTEDTVADTVCQIDDPILTTLDELLTQVGGIAWPARDSAAIMVGRPRMGETPDWEITAGEWDAQIDADKAVNEVVVWYKVPGATSEDAMYVPHPERIKGGPRAWGGPFGRKPKIVKLDESVSAAELRSIARRTLRDAQLASAQVSVKTRADPRREVGDLWRAYSEAEQIDCLCRCTAISLDAASGMSTIEGAVITGTVNGVSATYTDLSL